MSASPPNPPAQLPQGADGARPNDGQEQPLTAEEVDALIDFFRLLDTWDKKGKTT